MTTKVELEAGGVPISVSVVRVKGQERHDYNAFTSLHLEVAATIWRDPQQPRTHEWVVTWTQTKKYVPRDYYPTLTSAMYAIGKRVAK